MISVNLLSLGSRVVRGPPMSMPEGNDVATAANKQARMEEADTFRGVHLDPNAHHWDEVRRNCPMH